ncbi:MAG: hypothetical protein VX335_03525 [Pseudomonadota bacterium]|nr:hypothetical protein [Pseudomonadota bacterium]
MLRQRRKSQENMMSEERDPEGVESVVGVASISSQSSAEDIATNDIINNSGLPQNESTPNVEIFEQDSSTTELNSSMRSSAGGDSIRLEERQMPSNTLAERFINFADYITKKSVIFREDVLFLVYFGIQIVQQAVVCSSTAWALRLMDRSYNIKEAVTSVLIGTTAIFPLVSLHVYYTLPPKNKVFGYMSAAGVILFIMSVPVVGYAILKQTSGVEMHIGQHILVYISGTVAVTVLALSPGLIFSFYDYVTEKSVIVKEDVLFLVYFGLHCVQQAVACSSAAWALRLMDRSYNIKEAVTSLLIGTTAISPLGFILGFYEAAFRRNYLSEYTSAAGVILLAMSAPFVGYAILKQTSGVEMHIGQHIVVYIAGITLSLSPYLIFKLYNTYLTKPSGIVKEAALCFSAYSLQAVLSSSGALVLGLIDKSYNIKEAATSALIGTVALSPLFGLRAYLSSLQDNHNNVYEYMESAGKTVSFILIPFIGHEILKQTSGVEMHVGQHIAAYIVGYVTLLVPYVIISDMHFANLDRNRSNIQQTPAGLRARAAQQILQPETSNNLQANQANIDNTGTTRVTSSEPGSINSASVLAS